MEIPLRRTSQTPRRADQSAGGPAAGGGGMSHSVIIPESTYSPWLDDLEFMRIFNAISHNTLFDIYRCRELWSLVAQTASVPGDILEVGVWRGGTGALMAARSQGLDSGKRVYLCDTYTG